MLSTAQSSTVSSTVRSHYLVVDNFLPDELASAMRRDIEGHFSKPHTHRPDSHQIWNYWFVPQLYTYLRTLPEKIINRERVDQFMSTLKEWSSKTLGMKSVTHPYLSLYVHGCRQGLHNDAKNGRFAFVYSLTQNERKTVGGETIILHEGDLFRSKLSTPAAGPSFYTKISPSFNRLVVFDDRIPHGVESVEGPMDPIEGRFVLHGHISEAGPIVDGPLPVSTISETVVAAMSPILSGATASITRYHGPLVLRFVVNATGDVERCQVIVDRVIGPNHHGPQWSAVAESLVAAVRACRFPPSNDSTVVIEPIMFGAPISQRR